MNISSLLGTLGGQGGFGTYGASQSAGWLGGGRYYASQNVHPQPNCCPFPMPGFQQPSYGIFGISTPHNPGPPPNEIYVPSFRPGYLGKISTYPDGDYYFTPHYKAQSNTNMPRYTDPVAVHMGGYSDPNPYNYAYHPYFSGWASNNPFSAATSRNPYYGGQNPFLPG